MAGEIILVVEDNDVLRLGLQALLQSDGFEVHTAIHGVDALQKIASIKPSLILSDITMPEMDGYSFFEAVRKRPECVSIPFIFLTARRGREDIFAGRRLGVEDYLVKPVTRHELLTTVRSRLARSQQLQVAQLQQAWKASLIMLANAIELRDQHTRGHVERVRDYAMAIAGQMGWTEGQSGQLEYGSILHDIGKIQIPESVLKKPGKLTEAEWIEMKKHPIIGVELIKNIPFLASAVPVIRHHHERWDGTGYPDRLAGEQIPLSARIVAVADALDAMTYFDRPYRMAMSPEQAFEEIMRCSGTHFDPNAVRAFQRAWDKIEPKLRV